MLSPKSGRPRRRKFRKAILGVGLDNQDGEVRVTRVDDIHLVGGSEDTHAQMQEKAVKFNEEMARRGKNLQQTTFGEVKEIADQVDMPMP